MKDVKQREKGKYQEIYSKIINGVKVQIVEETVIGRDFDVLSFSREYDPGVPFNFNQNLSKFIV